MSWFHRKTRAVRSSVTELFPVLIDTARMVQISLSGRVIDADTWATGNRVDRAVAEGQFAHHDASWCSAANARAAQANADLLESIG